MPLASKDIKGTAQLYLRCAASHLSLLGWHGEKRKRRFTVLGQCSANLLGFSPVGDAGW